MDITKLSAEERKNLMAQLEAEQQAERNRTARERETYKEMVESTTIEVFDELAKTSAMLAEVKSKVFNSYKTILAMKQELYGYKDSQRSHTFTTDDGLSITIGYRVVDDYDDTVDVGIQKVVDFVTSLATDEQTHALVDTIMQLVRKDSKGRLNIGKVVQLEQLGERLGKPELKEAISIIKDAYRPKRTRTFVDVYYKDEDGKQQSLPLAISSVE